MDNDVLNIDISLEPIGAGGSRICYHYPGDHTKCIKICRPVSMLTKKNLRRCIRAWLAQKIPVLNTNWHEYRFWEKHIHNKPVPGLEVFFPIFYGTIRTSLGKGIVVECLRDLDGKISQSLETWLPAAQKTEQQAIYRQIEKITGIFIEHCLPCYDWGANNFLVQQTKDGPRLKLIDCEGNLGNREFIPVRTIVPSLRRTKLESRIRRQLLSWLAQYVK